MHAQAFHHQYGRLARLHPIRTNYDREANGRALRRLLAGLRPNVRHRYRDVLLITLTILLHYSFTVILLSRFMLGLRGLYLSEDTSEHTQASRLPVSALRSQSTSGSPTRSRLSAARIVGNLGATVDICCVSQERRDGGYYEDEVPEYSSEPFKAGIIAATKLTSL